ncbi:MAG: 50S ribosomal protein L18e [Euryarchaeota archaeon]|nr:50S ribosomal protein L18e [Euryarchaeota archaeon]
MQPHRGRKDNPHLAGLIGRLQAKSRESKQPLWEDLARRLQGPRRHYASVNLSRINRTTQTRETIVVPGRVLSSGALDHPVTIAALGFSRPALDKIVQAQGRALTLDQLLQEGWQGPLRIMG